MRNKVLEALQKLRALFEMRIRSYLPLENRLCSNLLIYKLKKMAINRIAIEDNINFTGSIFIKTKFLPLRKMALGDREGQFSAKIKT
ncbi:hypothetical protein NAB43_07900 [Proteus mirabilis]|uniref:hypothetical protein n=1 Tax=Proteus mirabilis TaxID=584 RepID=UPI001A2BE91C|nr:hypothetical protein [Proteus mirabilis]ELT4983485.1 hypothetical protein [Proteus mirabilis]MCL8569600.1 hypothetical protein [Proteus mirabilis]MCL8623585.1 hypothetical protein [Proteus mirabilis]HAT5574288.1 hypothetical protein [Proteus mirabilis]